MLINFNGIYVAASDYRLIISDSGCYCQGWYVKLPSGWCFIEIAVWYRGDH